MYASEAARMVVENRIVRLLDSLIEDNCDYYMELNVNAFDNAFCFGTPFTTKCRTILRVLNDKNFCASISFDRVKIYWRPVDTSSLVDMNSLSEDWNFISMMKDGENHWNNKMKKFVNELKNKGVIKYEICWG